MPKLLMHALVAASVSKIEKHHNSNYDDRLNILHLPLFSTPTLPISIYVDSLDLTPAVFKKLADLDKGVIPIRWCVIGEKGCKKPSKGGSSKKHGKGDDEDDEHT